MFRWASVGDAVGLGDAEGLVIFSVGPLAVFAAILDEAAAGLFLLLTVLADHGTLCLGPFLGHWFCSDSQWFF